MRCFWEQTVVLGPIYRALGRENGSYGGQARAILYDKGVLSEWASWGGKAVLKKYGREYFVEIRKKRKNYPKYID